MRNCQGLSEEMLQNTQLWLYICYVKWIIKNNPKNIFCHTAVSKWIYPRFRGLVLEKNSIQRKNKLELP